MEKDTKGFIGFLLFLFGAFGLIKYGLSYVNIASLVSIFLIIVGAYILFKAF